MLLTLLFVIGCGETQLDHAVEKGSLTKAKVILTIHPKFVKSHDEDGRTRLHKAALKNRKEVVELLVAKDAELNAQDRYGFTPLHYAAQRGHPEVAQLLIAEGADPGKRNHYDYTPLHWAAVNGHKDIIEILMDHGSDVFAPDRNGETPAQLAYEYGHIEIVDLLLPFHMAAKRGGLSRLRSLLSEHPQFIDATDGVGRTPLHMAFRFNRSEEAEFLIANGADTNIKDHYGRRPHYYSESERRKRTGIDLLDPTVVQTIDYVSWEMTSKYAHINIALVVDGKIVFSKAYGENSLVFTDAWGSVSKPVTAMIVMNLVSRGRIESIDDPIWKYSPRYLNCMPVQFADDSVTIRHLLIHKSGVPHNDEPTWKDGKLNLKFKPGTQNRYSTPGYGIIGHVIEDITGLSYSDAVKTYIGKPVEAPSYWVEKHFRGPGARVHSTIKDMALFSLGVMNHVYVPEDLFYNEMIQYHNGPAGIGWGITNLNDNDLTLVHGGSNGTPQAYLEIKPRKKLSVSILARSKDRRIFELGELSSRLMSILDSVK